METYRASYSNGGFKEYRLSCEYRKPGDACLLDTLIDLLNNPNLLGVQMHGGECMKDEATRCERYIGIQYR